MLIEAYIQACQLFSFCHAPFALAVQNTVLEILNILATIMFAECVEVPISDKNWIDVVVVSVVDTRDFCVQLLHDKCSKALENLTEEMQKYFGGKTTGQYLCFLQLRVALLKDWLVCFLYSLVLNWYTCALYWHDDICVSNLSFQSFVFVVILSENAVTNSMYFIAVVPVCYSLTILHSSSCAL